MHFVTAGCKPAEQERRAKLTNIRAASRACKSFTPLMWIRALATLWYTLCRPYLPKMQPHSFLHVEVPTEPSPQSCALLVDNFPRSTRETAETETLLRRHQEPHSPEKIQGVGPENVFTREFTHFRTGLLLYCSHRRTALATKLLLPWWWPDDKTGPGHSSVTRKFSNFKLHLIINYVHQW